MEKDGNSKLQDILDKLRVGKEAPEKPTEESVVPEQEEEPYLGPCGMTYPKCQGPHLPDGYEDYSHIPEDVYQHQICQICTISPTYNPKHFPEIPKDELIEDDASL